MQKPDEFRVTFDQNPAMAEAIRGGGMKVADTGKAELRYTIKAIDDEGVDLIAEAVIPEGYEVGEEPESGSMMGASGMDAVRTPLSMLVRKKRAK